MAAGQRIIIVGAGIDGVVAAIELKQRGHNVTLIDPGPLPHPLAASTDISKAVRASYGKDEDYTALAERCIRLWREWNTKLTPGVYHEVGMMFLRQNAMEPGDFEYESRKVFERRRHPFQRLNSSELRERFPAWNGQQYADGIFEPEAGFVESARAVAALAQRAQSLGVKLQQDSRFADLQQNGRQVTGVSLITGQVIPADTVVMTVGAWTPYLLPFTKKFLRASGHSVFHLRPSDPRPFRPECFPVFGADISTTGYYGFPLNRDGIVKIANHGPGREMSPDSPAAPLPHEEAKLREFLAGTLPGLNSAPIVHTRMCFYCDTHDGHFWIAPDPDRAGLIIAAGDSGHGFKFAPMLGGIIADAVEGNENPWLKKFRWRPEITPEEEKEAARFRPNGGTISASSH